MAATNGSEGDLMAVAIFCLEQARQAKALVRESSDEPDYWHGLDEFDRFEYYVLKLDHVYEACCQLNRIWPSAFTRPARNAANSFIQLWNGVAAEQLCKACASNESHDGPTRQSQALCQTCKDAKQRCRSCLRAVCDDHSRHQFGTDLRDAYAHYEEALATPGHERRGQPAAWERTVRGVDVPSWGNTYQWTPGEGPDGWRLIGKEYRLDGAYDALVELERELADVLVDPATGKLRPDA